MVFLIFQIAEVNTLFDEGTCSSACQDNSLCNWYTYFQNTGKCFLYNSCQIEDDLCGDCLTSEKACDGEQSPGMT